MTDTTDCRFFEDQLDALVRGELPREGRTPLRAHAAECRECDALLRVQEHLHGPSLDALEAEVPDAWVSAMWSDVRSGIEGRRRRPGRRWAVPLLSAATVTLILAGGLGLRALQRAHVREAELTAQLLDQQRRLAELGPPRPERLPPGPGPTGGQPWIRALEARGEVTVAELRAWLRELPDDTRLASAPRAGAPAAARLVPGPWRRALTRLDAGGEVTAADLLAVLDDLGLAEGTSVPAARLIELLS